MSNEELIEWLDDNSEQNNTNNNNNNTNNQNNNTHTLDPLFDDLSNNTDVDFEINMTEDDTAQWIPTDYTGANPDADYYDGGDGTEDNNGDDSPSILFGLLTTIIAVGGAIGKL